MSTTKPWAVVTGGSRGIGASIAKALASDGFHVVVNYAASEGPARAVVDAIAAAGGSAQALRFDVANSAEVAQSFETLAKELGGAPAVLVNNAGINVDALLIRLKDEDLDRVLNVDLKGAIYCTREAAKLMMRARKGSVVQVSSVVGEMGNAGQSAYAAAKAGLIGFSKSVAKELASRAVRVNVVTPGFIATEMTGALTDAQKEAIVRGIPMGTLGAPEDVANLVTFLASERSRYITGQVISINGGLYM